MYVVIRFQRASLSLMVTNGLFKEEMSDSDEVGYKF